MLRQHLNEIEEENKHFYSIFKTDDSWNFAVILEVKYKNLVLNTIHKNGYFIDSIRRKMLS